MKCVVRSTESFAVTFDVAAGEVLGQSPYDGDMDNLWRILTQITSNADEAHERVNGAIRCACAAALTASRSDL